MESDQSLGAYLENRQILHLPHEVRFRLPGERRYSTLADTIGAVAVGAIGRDAACHVGIGLLRVRRRGGAGEREQCNRAQVHGHLPGWMDRAIIGVHPGAAKSMRAIFVERKTLFCSPG